MRQIVARSQEHGAGDSGASGRRVCDARRSCISADSRNSAGFSVCRPERQVPSVIGSIESRLNRLPQTSLFVLRRGGGTPPLLFFGGWGGGGPPRPPPPQFLHFF